MPKTTTPKTPKSSADVKPYTRSPVTPPPASSDCDPSSSSPSSGSPKKKRMPETKGKGWTAQERLQLFERVAKAGMARSTWEGAVEGRNANQCYQAWIKTVTPLIRKALTERP